MGEKILQGDTPALIVTLLTNMNERMRKTIQIIELLAEVHKLDVAADQIIEEIPIDD
jgi:hypothetical protein